MAKSTELGNTIEFLEDGCHVLNKNGEIIATASKHRNLYYLNCSRLSNEVNAVTEEHRLSKEYLWHSRLGHLNVGAE